MSKVSRFLLSIMLATCAIGASAQFRSEFGSPSAAESFRLGVLAYHAGRFSEALLLFEKALAYDPGQKLISYWLGRAYYRLGLDATATAQWRGIMDESGSSILLEGKIDSIESRHAAAPTPLEQAPVYVESYRLEGSDPASRSFSRPSWIQPFEDGSFLLVAHGSNELIRFDAEGVVRARMKASPGGFDRPYAAVRLPDGGFYVSEMNGDRVSRCDASGRVVSTIGSRGRGEGQFLGPQYLAVDALGYLFVVDYGNARVSRFAPDGAYVSSFGSASDGFPGFRSPTGIAIDGDRVYVADNLLKSVYRFDLDGNFISSIAEGRLSMPEGLLFEAPGELLIADGRRIVSLDIADERIDELYLSPDRGTLYTCAAFDAAGDILACDFNASTVLSLSESASLFAGYEVEIERIDAGAFPRVELELSVNDRFGRPVLGLGKGSFHLTERIERRFPLDGEEGTQSRVTESLDPVESFELLGSGRSSTDANLSLVFEASPFMEGYREELRDLVDGILSSVSGTDFRLVSAGKSPSAPAETRERSAAFISSFRGDADWSFDLGVRLAAARLLGSGVKRTILFVGSGAINEEAMGALALSDLASYLRNNGIAFYAILVRNEPPSAAIRYLVEETRGEAWYMHRPEGLRSVVAAALLRPSGKYRIAFTSLADPKFGLGYLSVAVEAYRYKRSGRDELGYFAPLR